jgi:hypothetical protein
MQDISDSEIWGMWQVKWLPDLTFTTCDIPVNIVIYSISLTIFFYINPPLSYTQEKSHNPPNWTTARYLYQMTHLYSHWHSWWNRLLKVDAYTLTLSIAIVAQPRAFEGYTNLIIPRGMRRHLHPAYHPRTVTLCACNFHETGRNFPAEHIETVIIIRNYKWTIVQ